MISIDWGTRVINIPKSFMTLAQENPFEVRELDLNAFRLALKNLEDSEEGMCFPDTHLHNTEAVLSGVTYARLIKIINDYTISFEQGSYAVNAVGANSNLADVMNLNSVSLRTFNAAGLVTVVSGSGVTEQDKLDIADRVWDEILTQHSTADTTGEALAAASGGSSLTPKEIAEAVWDEAKADHNEEGSFGEEIQIHLTPDISAQIVEALATYAGATKTDLTTTQSAVIAAVPSVEDIEAHLADTHGEANWGAVGPTLEDIKEAVWNTPVDGGTARTTLNQIHEIIEINACVLAGRWKIENNQMTFYREDDITPLFIFNLYDDQENPTMEKVFERRPVR